MAKERKPGAYQNAVHEAYARNTNNTEYMGYMLLGAGGVIAAPLVLPMVVEGAVFVSPYVANGAVQTGRFAWNFAKQPFVAAGGSSGTGAQIQAFYQFGSFGAYAINQLANGNNFQTWNYGSSFGNLYFKNEYISNAFGAGYSKLQGHSNSYVISNYFLGIASNKLSNKIKGSEMIENVFKNQLLQHGSGAFTLPLIINTGSNLSPIKN